MTKKTGSDHKFILSLGGSLIVTEDGIQLDYLQKFNDYIRGKISQNYQFFIVCGGGVTARKYQQAVKKIIPSHARTENLDWIGISATRLNALLLQTIFKDIAYPEVISNYERFDSKLATFPLVLGAGWKPGYSTDYDTVLLAEHYQADTIINLTNIDYVYESDPRKNPDAKPIKQMNWTDLLQITGTEWVAGLNVPFDPIGAQKARDLGLKVIICNGQDLDNLELLLTDRDFTGTIIQ